MTGCLSDLELVDSYRRGNEDAFEELLERYKKMVFRLCWRMLNSMDDSQDATQQVFVNAFKGLSRFNGRSSVKTWFYAIALNECRRRLRKRMKIEDIATMNSEPSISNTQEDIIMDRQQQTILQNALQELSFKQHAAITLRINEEMSFSEVAAVLGCSVNSAKVNFCHGLNRLKEITRKVLDNEKD